MTLQSSLLALVVAGLIGVLSSAPTKDRTVLIDRLEKANDFLVNNFHTQLNHVVSPILNTTSEGPRNMDVSIDLENIKVSAGATENLKFGITTFPNDHYFIMTKSDATLTRQDFKDLVEQLDDADYEEVEDKPELNILTKYPLNNEAQKAHLRINQKVLSYSYETYTTAENIVDYGGALGYTPTCFRLFIVNAELQVPIVGQFCNYYN